MKVISTVIVAGLMSCVFAGHQTSHAPFDTQHVHLHQSGHMFTQSIEQKDIDQFATVMAQIQHYYIEPVDYHTLFTHAIHGMVNKLDPHSMYLPPAELHDLFDNTQGEFAGIGISLTVEDGLLRVITPIDDSPAAKADIQSNDIIFKVNDQLISQIGPEKALVAIKGKKGTTVRVTTYRPSTKDVKEHTLIRDNVSVQSVHYKRLNNLARIRISSFGEKTTQELRTILKKTQRDKTIQGYIIDLRNNPGGLLHTAVETTDLFLDAKRLKDKTIVSTKGRIEAMDTIANATAGDVINNAPLVVLINHGSASAAEIMSAAISEHHRGITLGTQTFGKGSVQTILPTSNDSAIKLTTALYYTPSGKSIQATGVRPDIVVKQVGIQNEHTEKSIHDVITEASLSNHISAQKEGTITAETALNSKALDEIIHKDFQMYQAAKILETIIIAKQVHT